MKKLFRGGILGAPASGKGTISSRITNTFDVIHISTGDILRKNIKDQTALGKEAVKFINEGKLVPDALVLNVVLEKLKNLSNTNCLFDGFPRNVNQTEELLKTCPLTLIINLNVPFEEIVDRVQKRWVHIPSGRVYNTDFKPPKTPGIDDITGEPLVQRPDDKPEALMKRLNVYKETTEPLLTYYRKKGILMEFSGKSSNEMWPHIKETLLKYMDVKS